MALPGWSVEIVLSLSRVALDSYFDSFARYDGTSPGHQYAIRVGSRTMWSNDTMDLKNKMIRYLGNQRRIVTRAKTKTNRRGDWNRNSRKGSGA